MNILWCTFIRNNLLTPWEAWKAYWEHCSRFIEGKGVVSYYIAGYIMRDDKSKCR